MRLDVCLRVGLALLPLLLPALAGCDGAGGGDSGPPTYDDWPDPDTVFPYVYTPEEGLEPYEEVRWETETWDPETDPDNSGLYLTKALLHRKGAPAESLAHFDVMRGAIPPLPTVEGGARLSFVGDVMWMGENWDTFALPAAGLLDGDLRVGNLETPVSADDPTAPGELGLYRFNSPPEILDGLPFDAIQLNNNHSLDVGDSGLEATVAAVTAHGFAPTGVDTHATVAAGDTNVALLSYTWGVNRRDFVSTHELFVVPFGHLDEVIELSGIAADIAAARAGGADTVVVLVHWGYEYEYYPDPHFLQLGRQIVALGADLIVGEGPHVAQPAELCYVNHPEVVPGIGTCSVRTEDGAPRTAAILYSLGNFGTTLPTLPCQAGMVASVAVGKDSAGATTVGLGWSAAVTVDGDDGLEVLPLADALDDTERADEAERLDAHLGTSWKR
jgi:poly-gamma-glutamate synthesis protein (capsule biosynthesis protein)